MSEPSREDVARQSLESELGRIVANALRNGEALRVGYHAGMLFAAYPESNLSISHILHELTSAAKDANIPIQTGRWGEPL